MATQFGIGPPPLEAQRTRARHRVGDTVEDKWTLDELLALGGMGAVYAATHRNGNRVALKIMHPELANTEASRRAFVAEGYIANQIDHPAAVSVHDDGVTGDGCPFLVQELLVGETLAERIVRDPLSVTRALEIATVVLALLDVAHEKGTIHCDIKPANIFLEEGGRVRVLDFGISRAKQRPAHDLSSATTILGTPGYMPPEQARGDWLHLDATSDVWAVGATLFHCLTGRTVHLGSDASEVLRAAKTQRAPSLQEVLPDVAPEVAAAIDGALRFERNERWASARGMAEAVERALDSSSASSATLAPVARFSFPRERSSMLGKTAVMVVGTIVLLVVAWPDNEPSGRVSFAAPTHLAPRVGLAAPSEATPTPAPREPPPARSALPPAAPRPAPAASVAEGPTPSSGATTATKTEKRKQRRQESNPLDAWR